MSKRYLVGGLVFVFALVLVVVGITKNDKTDGDDNGGEQSGRIASLPQIEIVAPTAYLLKEDGSRDRVLNDNDFVTPPATVEVTTGGEAVIHFMDGSMARVAGGTTFEVKEAAYEEETGKSNVSIIVRIGTVWSKVIELATPDSSWEVETSSAVATVRGTAFDTHVDAEGSTFLGSENNVTITPFDTNTKKRATNSAADLGEGKYIEVKKAVLADVLSGKKRIAAASMTAAMQKEGWVTRNGRQDFHMNNFVKEMKDRGLDRKAMREEMRNRMKNEIREKIMEDVRNGVVSTSTIRAIQQIRTDSGTILAPRSTSTSPVTTAKPIAVEVVARVSLDGLKEGTTVQFRAMAKLSDGTFRDVTDKVSWKVLGSIGSVTATGLFLTRLGVDVAEAGESSGAVIATFTTATGEIFLGKTPLFKVSATALLDPNLSG